MFFDVIATNLFSDTPNAPEVPLPYGLGEKLFDKWLDIVAEYKLDKLAAQWLITHRDLIDEIHSQLPTGNEPTPTSPDPDDPNPEVPVDMKELIEFCAEVGLNQEQWRYLLENPGFLEAMKEVFHGNFRDEKAKYAVKSTINLQMNGWFDKADWTEAELEDVLANEFKPSILHEHYIRVVQEYIILRYTDPRFKDPCDTWCTTKAWVQVMYNVSNGVIHTLLDICGIALVVGESCDLANGLIYTIEGDGINATFSFSAAIPVFGWASTAGKYIKIGLEVAPQVYKELKITFDGTKCIFSHNSSEAFREILNMTGSQWANFQAHHIIPKQLAEHPIVQKAAQSGQYTFHMNHVKNGIPLHNSRHLGNHLRYNNEMNLKLNELNNTFPNAYPSEIATRIDRFLHDLKSHI